MSTIPTQVLMQPLNDGVSNPVNTQISSPPPSSSGSLSTVSTPIVSPLGAETASTIINGREARNLAEKQRRDKLNASIGELAKMVPHVADSSRRLDKTAILRFATHGLRLQYVFGKSAAARKVPQIGENHVMTNALLHLLDSFFITLTCHGQIVLISSSVEHLLGHCQSDLYGQNLLQITHPEDQDILRQELIPSDIESLFSNHHNPLNTSSPKSQGGSSPNSAHGQHHCSYSTNQQQSPDKDDNSAQFEADNDDYLDQIDKKLRADKRSFTIRLARASSRSETKKVYEIIKINGCFRRSDFSALATGSCGYPIVSQLIRRSRNSSSSSMYGGNNNGGVGTEGVFIPHLLQHDAIAQAALHGVSGNDIVLVAMARIIRPPKVLNYSLEANRLEYKTRHLIDGRIIDCDNRIGLVAGYLKDEVRNLSPFSFMHQDDVRWVIVALRQMYDCNSDFGESCYRLLSRNGNFIYLNTKGFLEIDKGTNKVHSFVCVNTLLDEEEGKRRVQEMKNKFSIIINAKVPANTNQDAPASQNPQQLERIVLYLIENLQKRQTNSCVVDEIHSEDDAKRHTNTPPLALVPPETASVKSSISKSVSVVIATAAKCFAVQQQQSNLGKNNAENSKDASDAFTKTSEQKLNTSTQTQTQFLQNETMLHRPSVLHMRAKTELEENCFPSSNFNLAKVIDSNAQQVSVLKRLHTDSATVTSIYNDSHDAQPAKRLFSKSSAAPLSSPNACCTTTLPLISTIASNDSEEAGNIHDFISSSLRHVGESLDCIDVQTNNLRQSSSSLPTCLDNKLDAIIIEQKKQSEFLVNIKNEYEVFSRDHQHPNSLKYSQNSHLKTKNQHPTFSSPDHL